MVATTVAGQHWSQTAAAALTGRDVVILEDNDEAGRDNAIESADWLQRYAKSIKIVRLPELGEGQDVSDWLDAGHKIRELKKIVGETGQWGDLTPLPDLDPKKIPPRGWLYGRYYTRQFVSLTIAPGAASKSALLITEALAMATGKNLLEIKKPSREPLRVMYWNGEDTEDELHRRFAAAKKHFGIDHAAIGNRMFVQSGIDHPILFAESDGRKIRIHDAAFRKLRDTLRRGEIDVLILDPFVNLHNVEENNNTAIDRVVKTLARIAMECNCAIMLAHHSRKPGSREGNRTTVVEDGRGAIALRDAVRAARVLNRMTDHEVGSAKVEPARSGWYRRIDDGKANLMPPAELAEWFKMASVDLDNATEWGEGDDIGVAAQWDFPVQKSVAPSPGDIARALEAVRAGGPWRRDIQVKPEIWIGTPIARALGHDPNDKATRTRMNKLVGEWIAAGRLKLVTREHRRGKRGAELHDYVEVADPAPGSANPGEPPGGAPQSS